MAIFKCKMCGGSLEINNDESVATCDYCGTRQTVPTSKDDVASNLFNRANNLRLKCEFDKATQVYEKILDIDHTDSEAHWGVVLCKYGIEYVEDPKTFTRVPTCHRTLYEAVLTDVNYLSAIENANEEQKQLYIAEAKAIDELQKDILDVVNSEQPFDIFICYKETDENGSRTIDSTIANDIYYQLTQEGFKVFYAAITLEDKLGQEFEPYIFAALSSAKVMVVLGTKPEYFNAVWVRNEWSRFLQSVKTDRSKLLIPCYRDMDAYDLPEEFAHLQAQDMSKIGFIQDLIRGIKKISTVDDAKRIMSNTITSVESNSNITALLKRGFMALEDGAWSKADEFFEQCLNQNAEYAEAYLGKLMAELQVKKQTDLKDCATPFDDSNNYQKTIRFADDKLKSELQSVIEHINNRIKNKLSKDIYTLAINTMKDAKTNSSFTEAANLFEKISGYKDADALAQECHKKAEIAYKDDLYFTACNILDDVHLIDILPLEEAITSFKSLNGWKDSEEKIQECQKRIKVLSAELEAKRLKREQSAKLFKRISIVASSVGIVIMVILTIFNTIIPNSKYNNAINLMEEEKFDEALVVFDTLGDYKESLSKKDECATKIQLNKDYKIAIKLLNDGKTVEAYEALRDLGGYKDSFQKADAIYEDYKVKKLKSAKVGDCVVFGSYEQDNNNTTGEEEIEWIVLEVQDNKILVISKYALDAKPFNSVHSNTSWENCSLRYWLQNTFLKEAFTGHEQNKIQTTSVLPDTNTSFSAPQGNTTQDKIFLLSVTEAEKYFKSSEDRVCQPTAFASSQDDYTGYIGKNCEWWLRTMGDREYWATTVYKNGLTCSSGGDSPANCNGVRPAMWIDIS